mmetsp:Transcript_13429/g.29437  ORF Transcript_13429/g.29437 Transcript_13429/m.29437 type:complete len:321 (+) Transcript_13429:108-1070(+)
MAVRTRLSIQPGSTITHTVPFAGEDGSQSALPVGLRWNAVVLDELTVDLEISAALRLPDGADSADSTLPAKVVLERDARGTNFVGAFEPARSRRLASALGRSRADSGESEGLGQEVSELVFVFSNRASWFTAKEVELVTVLEWPAPPSVPPPAIPVPAPSSAPARGRGQRESSQTLSFAPVVLAGSGNEVPDSEAEGSSALASRVVDYLDELCASKALSTRDPRLADISSKIVALRDLCVSHLASPPEEPQTHAGAAEPTVAAIEQPQAGGQSDSDEEDFIEDSFYEDAACDNEGVDELDEEACRRARALEKAQRCGRSI